MLTWKITDIIEIVTTENEEDCSDQLALRCYKVGTDFYTKPRCKEDENKKDVNKLL